MTKWILLAAGVFLFTNGMYTRTYGYEDPGRYCYQMDLIDLYGCFASPAVPRLIHWSAILIGAGLMLWSLIRSRRRTATSGGNHRVE
ncbi:MAG: hypothetical protein K5872_09835 [Rhizobiaceae bacterium]|nr:hypothetical protein [Rhizobiaceae bacterium]MCV0406514.1 hypothetical protein [Rhizobiaceae bacterium]